ncbi:porin family protein [Tenacibaculum salmonis]|uniref:porin family protein n=1 Tax=Tenacibaculum sp. P3-BQ1 TaxID=3232310 RepID=UPI0034DF7AC4
MKKVLLIIAIVAAGFTANAQEVSFGAKAGLNIANYSKSTDDIDSEARTSFHIGAVAEIKISDKFSFQPELIYSEQGATIDYTETTTVLTEFTKVKLKGNIKLNYLNIPLMAKYYVMEGLSLEAGPQVGFLLSNKSKIKTTVESSLLGESGTETSDLYLKDNLKSVDFGLNFGAGYKLDNGLNFSARYNLGLSNMNDYEDNGNSRKNGVFQLSVGYFF